MLVDVISQTRPTANEEKRGKGSSPSGRSERSGDGADADKAGGLFAVISVGRDERVIVFTVPVQAVTVVLQVHVGRQRVAAYDQRDGVSGGGDERNGQATVEIVRPCLVHLKQGVLVTAFTTEHLIFPLIY